MSDPRYLTPDERREIADALGGHPATYPALRDVLASHAAADEIIERLLRELDEARAEVSMMVASRDQWTARSEEEARLVNRLAAVNGELEAERDEARELLAEARSALAEQNRATGLLPRMLAAARRIDDATGGGGPPRSRTTRNRIDDGAILPDEAPCPLCGAGVEKNTDNPDSAYMDGWHHKGCLDTYFDDATGGGK